MSIPSHSDFQPIEAIDALDLSRHALMEASAGTGKTYTIENLVVRLLKEEAELNLENILLVTFTEKATGELKQRIRLKIEQTLDGEEGLSDRVREKLGDTLDGFDNAAISTIHGFCHTLLKEYPFETGNLFRQELIDDGPLLEGLLRTQMRQDWPLRYGRRLPLLLDLVDFSADVDGFFFTVIRLVRQLSQNPGRGTLIPDPAELDLEDLWQALTTTVLSLKALAEDPPGLVQGYGRLNINKRSRSAVIRDLMQPLQQLLARVSSDDLQLVAFKPMVAYLKARHSSGGRNIDRLVPTKWLKAGNNLHACPNLTAVRDRLAELVRLFARLAHLLMLTAVDQLRHEASVTKARRGWISYQDMLNRVADFLTGVWAED
ncbi:MAG: UvrD-helicase domain-containing protein, partial [Desulfosarcina sp.]